MAKLVSKIYGDALFDLGLERGNVDGMTEEVMALQRTLAETPELMQFLENPDIAKSEKLALLERVFKGQVSDDIVGFLSVVMNKERYRELGRILDYYIARAKEYHKIGVAVVTAPQELSEEWKKKIEQRLLDTTRYEKMEITYATDPKLIGGLVIRIGDTVVDSSIKSRLEDISHRLMGISVA